MNPPNFDRLALVEQPKDAAEAVDEQSKGLVGLIGAVVDRAAAGGVAGRAEHARGATGDLWR